MEDKDLPFPSIVDETNENKLVFAGNITKSEISSKADIALQHVNEGEIDSIDMYVKARAMREVCDEIIDRLKPKVEEKLARIHSQERKFFGVEIQMSEGSTKYSYDHDATWCKLSDDVKNATKKLKDYESLMKTAVKTELYNSDGTQIEPAQVSGGTGSVLKVIIPK